MYLTNLKIHGFKSFANKTVMDFNGGLTCVVGPNGCGKSNLVDAIRWVLGEQRSAVLRSEKMENVIFSGSSAARPLGMAEVSITIKNTRKILPIEYSEVVVTRRLYRSGESEYLLNKTPCRLKDIRDLFMDTGVGPDSYSVIELKMVETILSPRSDERLGLFEEAAGINKYKQRRSAAFRKLDATGVDLNRVVDIIAEVERNVHSLKRQVSRAERYQALQREIEELEIRSASLEYGQLLKTLQPLKVQLEQLEKHYQQKRSMLSREEAGLERDRVALMNLEETLSTMQGELSSLTDTIHQKENEIVAAKERLRAMEEKIDRFAEERLQLEKRAQTLKSRLDNGEPKLGRLAEKLDALRIKHRLKEQEVSEFEKALTRRRLDANEARIRLIELLEAINEKEKERNRLESQRFHLEGRKEQLTQEIDRLRQHLSQIAGDEQTLSARERELEKKLDESEENLSQVRELLHRKQQEEEGTREERLRLKNRLHTLQQQKSFFENLIEMNEGYPDGVEFILEESQSHPGVLGLLADLLRVPGEYRVAVEAILGEKAFYVVVRRDSDAYQMIRLLRERKLGQVTFLVLARVGVGPENQVSSPRPRGVLAAVPEVIQSSPELQPVIELLFGSYLLVRDEKELPKVPAGSGWGYATLDGEVFVPTGVMKSGRYESAGKVSTISRSMQLEEVHTELVRVEKQLAVIEQEYQNKKQQIQILTRDVERWEKTVQTTREKSQQNRIETTRCQTTRANLEANLDAAQKELHQVEQLYSSSQEQIQQLNPILDALVRKRRRFEDDSERQQEKLEELESQRNQLAGEAHELNVNMVRTLAEKNGLESDLKRMRRTIAELENTMVRRREEIDEARQEIARLKHNVRNLEGELSELRHQKDELLSAHSARKQEYLSLQEEVTQKENLLKQTRKEGEASADVLQNLRLTISENELQIQNLQKGIQQKYGLEITPIEGGIADELPGIRGKLERLQEKLRAFGAVNLLALEEYKKEAERLEFLYRQKNDLVEAQATLLETIQVINKTAHQKFNSVFGQIRDNFRQNFASFFEGGEGDLRIRFDPEDPLSAEITILARPGGKQLGAIELLSAGEKALTAIALLFSIYQVKPSPFCILDEVDAPLDDVNIQRFLRVLHSFSNNTQFIVVTHNKLTMEASDFIYGVTMAQEGISKIVSVELNKVDEFVQSNQ